jgi:hypothetical protein
MTEIEKFFKPGKLYSVMKSRNCLRSFDERSSRSSLSELSYRDIFLVLEVNKRPYIKNEIDWTDTADSQAYSIQVLVGEKIHFIIFCINSELAKNPTNVFKEVKC